MEYLNTKTNEFYSFSELKVKFDDLRVANFTNNFTVKDWNPDFAQIIHTQMPCAGNHEKVIRDGNTLKEGVTPGLDYDNEIDSIDSLLPEIFNWTRQHCNCEIQTLYQAI